MAGLNLDPALWARPSESPVRKELVGQHHYKTGEKDGKAWKREGGIQRGLGGRRWRKGVVESHYAAQWLWPDCSRWRPRGHCPPLGLNPLAEWKISVEHQGMTPAHCKHACLWHCDMYHLLARLRIKITYIIVWGICDMNISWNSRYFNAKFYKYLICCNSYWSFITLLNKILFSVFYFRGIFVKYYGLLTIYQIIIYVKTLFKFKLTFV